MSQRDRLLALVADDLREDCDGYRLLGGLMQDLYEQLLARDVPEIERLNARITAQVETLAQRAQRRSKVLAAFGLQSDSAGMQRLLACAPGNAELQQHWQQLGELAEACRQLNERNGKLHAMHHEILQQLIGQSRSPLYSHQSY